MAGPQTPQDVTLGEVHRLLTEVRVDVREMRKSVSDMAVCLSVQRDRVRRLEGIVYGSGGLAAAGFVTALWAAITGR